MTKLIFLAVTVCIVGMAFEFIKSKDKEDKKSDLRKYKYTRRQFFITPSEHEFYNALSKAVGDTYLIFTQVHLPTIIDHKVVGQNWKGAFSHINQKSVDFVLCDKAYISPKLAIELDDKTHQREDRIERDIEVERMLEEAGFPLLRIENHGRFNSDELKEKINRILINSK